MVIKTLLEEEKSKETIKKIPQSPIQIFILSRFSKIYTRSPENTNINKS